MESRIHMNRQNWTYFLFDVQKIHLSSFLVNEKEKHTLNTKIAVLEVKALDQQQNIDFEKPMTLKWWYILQEQELFVGRNDLITAHLKQTEIENDKIEFLSPTGAYSYKLFWLG